MSEVMDRETKRATAPRPAAFCGTNTVLWCVQIFTFLLVLRLTVMHPAPSLRSMHPKVIAEQLGLSNSSAQTHNSNRSKATTAASSSSSSSLTPVAADSTPSSPETPKTRRKRRDEDPCAGRPTPRPLPSARDRPPLLYFLHLPKSAGSTVTALLRQYAKITHGVPCAYLQDGESTTPDGYTIDDRPDLPSYRDLGNNSLEVRLLVAHLSHNRTAKRQLLRDGACRTMRGHVTLRRYDMIEAPALLVTVLRDPVQRFISMYDYGVKTQMGTAAWRGWMTASNLSEEMANPSSILHLPFYTKGNMWYFPNGQWISFFFYGVLHQMSGIFPTFSGIGDPHNFTMTNAAEMADRAMDYVCRMHVIGFQDDVSTAMKAMARLTGRWAKWSEGFLKAAETMVANLTPNKTSREAAVVLPAPYGEEVRRRLREEYRVYEFARRVVEYRGSVFAPLVPKDVRG